MYLSYFERSNNPYIERIVDHCASQNQKEILAMWVWLGRKSRKMAEAMKQSIHELKAEFVDLRVSSKKVNHFEITAIIFKVY